MKPTARATVRLSPFLCLAVAALALILCGCGSGSAVPGGGGSAAATATQANARRGQGAQGQTDNCQTQLGGFLGPLDALRRKLEVGLSYEQYAAEVGEIRTAYDRLPVDRLSLGCLIRAGTPAEKAFNEYIDAANTWGECLAEAGCRASTIELTLQRKWRAATELLSAAAPGAQAR